MIGDEVRHRVQEVRLAETRVPVDEERVVGLRGRLGNRERCRVGKTVRRADHERVERVLRVDPDRLAARDAHEGHRQGIGKRPPLAGGGGRRGLGPVDAHLDAQGPAAGIASAGAEQVEEVTLDPFAREIVGNTDDKRVAVELSAGDAAEPGLERGVVECLAQAGRYIVPKRLRRQLDTALHLPRSTSRPRYKEREHSSVRRGSQ